MGRRKSVIWRVLDSLVVCLNLSNPYTIFPCMLFTPHIGINSLIIGVITLLYLFVRTKGKILFPKDILLTLFIIINVYNILNCLREDSLGLGFVALFLASVLLYLLLFNIYARERTEKSFEESIYYVSGVYRLLCFYSLGIVMFMLVLIEALHINPLQNDISGTLDILEDNSIRSKYYFPYHLSLIMNGQDLFRLPFFHEYGTILGLFHEPHTMTYYVVPFFFLMFFLIKKKWIIYILMPVFIIYILVAASTTNIVCFLACVAIMLCFKSRTATFLIAGLVVLIIPYIINNPVFDLVFSKMESGSMTYSSDVLTYALTPKTLLGSNLYDRSYLFESVPSTDIGFIVFILNGFFVSILIYRIIKLLFRGGNYLYIGLFALYFAMHSAKVALNTYSLEILMLVIFIVSYSLKEKKGLSSNETKNKHLAIAEE